MLVRSLIRYKILSLLKLSIVQRVYILYENKGFTFLRPSLSRSYMFMYLFQCRLVDMELCLIFGCLLNEAFLVNSQFISMSLISISKGYIKAALILSSSIQHSLTSYYSHTVLFTFAYLLIALNPLFGSSSCFMLEHITMNSRFRSELAFLVYQ